VLTSGGVSTGDEDHVRAAVEQAGRLVFWRIAIKPGRPVALGQLDSAHHGNAVVLGLPGNPVAAFVTFVRVAAPVLAALGGASYQPPRPLPVPAGFTYRKKAARREYVRVHLDNAGIAHKHPIEGAGILTSLTETDGLVELPDDLTAVLPGDPVGFIPFAALLA
jgi:molybdopterin molybdotransferase